MLFIAAVLINLTFSVHHIVDLKKMQKSIECNSVIPTIFNCQCPLDICR